MAKDPHLNLIERYPEYEAQIRSLSESSSSFNEKAHEFSEVSEQLGEAEQSGSRPDEVDRLRRRQKALQSELLGLMGRQIGD